MARPWWSTAVPPTSRADAPAGTALESTPAGCQPAGSDTRVRRRRPDRWPAGEWTPARPGAWFAERVIAVKLEYELSVDPRERDALEALLAGGGAQLSCVDADTGSRRASGRSRTSAVAAQGVDRVQQGLGRRREFMRRRALTGSPQATPRSTSGC